VKSKAKYPEMPQFETIFHDPDPVLGSMNFLLSCLPVRKSTAKLWCRNVKKTFPESLADSYLSIPRPGLEDERSTHTAKVRAAKCRTAGL
jgi:hypothetical protein